VKQIWFSLLVLGLASAACTGTAGNEGGNTGDTSSGGDGNVGGSGSGARGGNGSGSNGGAGVLNGGASGAVETVGPSSRYARLSHKQWENATRDLLGLAKTPGLSASFTGDASHGRFDNEGGSLQVTNGLFSDYQTAAETLALQVAGDANVLGKLKPAGFPTTAAAQAKPFVESFGRRAFRRPLTTEEVDRYAVLFGKGPALYGAGDATTLGMRAVIEAMLQSPHFVYRVETGQVAKAANGKIPLTSWEMASRLSFSLSNTMPDAELFTAAAAGKFEGNVADVRAEVRKQATRLLSATGGKESVADFYDQALRLYTYDGIDKDVKKVPDFVAGIGGDMRKETLLFTAEVVNQMSGTNTDLLTAPFTFVNQRLAKVYGLQGTFSDQFQKVDLDPAQRAGLLTQSGFLASNAHRDDVDSIHRGVFVHLNVMCTDLPPPAKNVPPVPSTAGKTNRERVTAHTGPGTCGAACHAGIINPAGFAFEKFDAIGKYRTMDNGNPVDDSGTLSIDGVDKSWKSSAEFISLLSKSEDVHRCMTRGWLEYLFGRVPVAGDDALVNRLGKGSNSGGQSVKSLVLDLVTSESFLFRAAP
jgi:hypothetical protein